jgi:Protein of unknown function (DUF2442)
MAELTQQQIDAQIDRSIANAKTIDEREPRASLAFYDEPNARLIIHFLNGAIFSVPVNTIEELAPLESEVLAEVTLTPSGKGLRWDTPDIDLSITGLLLGIFGSFSWMAELGHKGGKVKTHKKAAAARENGKKGGRPRTISNDEGYEIVSSKKN